VGRGAIGNPWLFSGRALPDVSFTERLRLIRRHAQAMSDYYGEALGVVLFRKHVVRYVQGLRDATSVRPNLLAAETLADLFKTLGDWWPEEPAGLREPAPGAEEEDHG